MAIQVIVMTSDASMSKVLPGFAFLFNKHWSPRQNVDVVGFTKPDFDLPDNFKFHSIGKFEDYPANKWSNAMKKTIDEIAEDVFVLLLDDYWIYRDVDIRGMDILADYARQFENVVKIDVARDRLYSDPQRYFYDFNTYASAGYLDLIKSPPGTPYHLSLWGGIWRGSLMLQVLQPNETAQQIELEGSGRLSALGDSVLVLGTRQGPLVHGNILQSGRQGVVYADGGWTIPLPVLTKMSDLGLLDKLK